MNVYLMERLKALLDLPPEASVSVIEARIGELKARVEELEAEKREREAREQTEAKMSPWKRWLTGAKARG